MTVLDNTPRDQYTATGGQVAFSYTFEIAAEGDIAVLQNGVLLSLGTGAGEYAVTGVGSDTGGVVTLVTGATSGDIITLYRDMALERLTSYTNGGDFLAADVNNDYDRLWLALQQNTGTSNRALVAPNTDPTSINMTIPDKATRLNKFLKFNENTGNPEVSDATGLYVSAGMHVYDFTGDGATVNFTLGMEPGSENNTQVYIDGVYQQKDSYNVSGSIVQFSVAPLNLSTIEVMVVEALPVGATTASQVSFTQAGSTYGRNVQLKLQESVSVKDFGVIGDGVADDTAAIQTAIDYVEALPGGKLYFPRGSYSVSQITLGRTGSRNGTSYYFNNSNIVGNSSTPKTSIVQLKSGSCFIYDLKIAGNQSLNYQSGLHWYTNDVNTYYPGLVRIKGVQIDGCLIGFCIGALPSQPDPIPAQGVVVAEGEATDAPISESYVDALMCVDCIRDVYMRQPNGKLTFINPTLSSRNSAWSGTGLSAESEVVTLTVRSSELTILGGSLENIDDPAGLLASLQSATFNMTGTTVESKSPIYIQGTSRVNISKLQNWGLNRDATSFFWVDSLSDGYLNVNDSILLRGFGTSSTKSIVQTVYALTGVSDVNSKFWVNFARVQFNNPNWTQGSTYNPIVFGCRSYYTDCTIWTYSAAGTRVAVYKLHDGENKLGGLVDLSADTITAFSNNASATSGGWVFTNATGSGQWGKDASVPTIEGMTLTSSLRFYAPGALAIYGVSPKFDVTPQKLILVRGWMKTLNAGGQNLVRLSWYKFDGSASATVDTNLLSGAGGVAGPLGTTWSPFELWGQVPADATQAELFLYSETNAGFSLVDLKITESP
jgi:hypothetical protein